MMRKFLIGGELSRYKWPPVPNQNIINLLSTDYHRGTISSIGSDISSHANLAMAETITDADFTMLLDGTPPITFQTRTHKYLNESDLMFIQFKELYSLLFIEENLPALHRLIETTNSVVYEGETFQPDEQNRVNCNVVRARWLKADFSTTIDVRERFARAGAIRNIIITHHTSLDRTKGSIVWLEIDWFSMHDQPYGLGNNNQIFHKTVLPAGVHRFMPIQRVISKCALRICKYQHIDVYLTIPLPGRWAL